MKSEQVRELLPVYADGELDDGASAEVERHLAESDALREELARWQALREAAHRVVTATPTPAGLESRVRAAVGADHYRSRRLRVRAFGGVFAAAAAVALAVVLWPTQTTTANPRDIEPDRFAEVYLRCAVERDHNIIDVDLQDLAAVRKALAVTDDFPILTPDLSAAGFKLAGVCRCFGEAGVDVVHVHYRRGGETPAVVSVFSVDQKFRLCESRRCACRSGVHGAYEIAQTKDVTVCKWEQKYGSYAVCGRMNPEQLEALADQMRIVKFQKTPAAYARAD